MYKRCIIDDREQEPKRLFYLVQFLMYDKERKGFITEEDTLEILYIRHEDRFTAAIEDIFEYIISIKFFISNFYSFQKYFF